MYLQEQQELEKRVLNNMMNKKEKKEMKKAILKKNTTSSEEGKDDFKEKNTAPITAKAKTKEEGKPKPKKHTRAEVFKELMKTGGGGTRDELTKKMIAKYGGSENEAEFQITTFIRLLVTLGYATKDEKGKITLK